MCVCVWHDHDHDPPRGLTPTQMMKFHGEMMRVAQGDESALAAFGGGGEGEIDDACTHQHISFTPFQLHGLNSCKRCACVPSLSLSLPPSLRTPAPLTHSLSLTRTALLRINIITSMAAAGAGDDDLDLEAELYVPQPTHPPTHPSCE